MNADKATLWKILCKLSPRRRLVLVDGRFEGTGEKNRRHLAAEKLGRAIDNAVDASNECGGKQQHGISVAKNANGDYSTDLSV